MAGIRPFRAVRYDPALVGDLADVLAPPYDVISPQHQDELYARSPFNAVRLEFGREEPDDAPGRDRYTRAAAQYRAWLAQGILRPNGTPALYVYEERFSYLEVERVRLGLFAALRLEPWEADVILPHEHTLPKPKADRLNLLRACKAVFSPIFLLYEDGGEVRCILEAGTEAAAPLVDIRVEPGAVAEAAERHRVWALDGPAAEQLQAFFAGKRLFIADGHHRYETALAYRDERRAADPAAPPVGEAPYDYTLAYLADFDDPGLTVLPIHRLVRNVPDLDRQKLLLALERSFSIKILPIAPGEFLRQALAELRRAGQNGAHAFGLVGAAPRAMHLLTLRPAAHQAWLARPLTGHSEAWRRLDVSILHTLVLRECLGLGDEAVEGEGQVSFTRDAEAAVLAVERGEYQLAFLLNPTTPRQIRDVALAHDRMPQKSSFFWPKPPAGLVCLDYERSL